MADLFQRTQDPLTTPFAGSPVLTSDQIMAQLDALHPAAKAAALGASKIISQQPPAETPPAAPNTPPATSGAAPSAETAPPPPGANMGFGQPTAPMRPIGGPKIPQGLGMPTPESEEHTAELNRLTAPPLGRNDPLAHTKADTGLPGWQQIKNPIGRTFAGIGQAALGGFFPSVAMAIPGTDLHHNVLVNQAARAQGRDTAERSATARQDLEEAQAEHAHAQATAVPLEKPTNEWVELKEPITDPKHPELGPQPGFFNKNTEEVRYGNVPLAAKPGAEKPNKADLKVMHAEAVADALKRGVSPGDDPKVQQIAESITSLQKQPTEKEPNRDDKAIAIYAKPKAAWTPDEKSYIQGYEKQVKVTKTEPGVARISVLGNIREMPSLDTSRGNAPTFATPNQINKEPGRFMPTAGGTQALKSTGLIEDIRGNINQTRQTLNAIPDFSGMDKAKIAVALRSRDPQSAIAPLISGAAAGHLTPQQQDYLISLTNLVENAMAMRSVLGAGQGSEDLRSAITAVIPGPATPSKEYAAKQLDAFEKTLNRLERGIPKVNLRTDTGTTAGEAGGGDPRVKAYADKYFEGDVNKAQAAIDQQRKGQ